MMNFQTWLPKSMSKISSRFIWLLLFVIVISIILIPLIGEILPCMRSVSKFWVDIFSPVSLRQISYKGSCEDNIGITSAIAYAIGFVLITIFLIPIVTNYMRTMGDRYLDGTLKKYAWKDHILFLGFDSMMLCALKDAYKQGKQVVVAVPTDVRQVRDRLREMLPVKNFERIEVVQCNKCDVQDLIKKACVSQAYEIFIIGQSDDPMHDTNNLKSLDFICDMVDSPENFRCHIHIRNIVTFSLMQRQGLGVKESLRNKAMAFNFYENIAGNLLSDFESGKKLMTLDYQNERQNLASCPGTTAHLLILGMTQMGLALAREALMVAHYPNHRVKITLVDDHARQEMFYFMGRYKELFKCCQHSYAELDTLNPEEHVPIRVSSDPLLDVEFEFIQGSIAHPNLMNLIEAWTKDKSQILTMAVCTNDSPKNMATALYLPRTLLEGDNPIHVWVYQHDDDSMQGFSDHPMFQYLHVFSPGEYGSLNTPGNTIRELVESVDFAYRQSYNPDAKEVGWMEMSHYERWSNVYNVRSIIAKLRGLGYAMTWANGAVESLACLAPNTPGNCEHFPTEEEILQLSVTEQFRWVTDTLTRGFRPTTEEEHDKMVELGKDFKKELKNRHFAHDDIRPFDKLDEETAKINIDMTKAIIDIIKKRMTKKI